MKNVAKKFLNVTKKVVKVKKSGYNKHQNYHYSTESDLIEAVREHLLNEGLVVLSSTEEVNMTDTITKVKMKHLIIDSESGEHLELFSQGFGNLTVGKDKSVFAALTGSFKYFISKNFMIASEDDPENDEFEDTKGKLVDSAPKSFSPPKITSNLNVETKPSGPNTVEVTLSGSSTTTKEPVGKTFTVPTSKTTFTPPKATFTKRKAEPDFGG